MSAPPPQKTRRRTRGRAKTRFLGIERRLLLRGALVAAALFVVVAALLVRPFWQLAGQFGSVPAKQPSRLYGRPLALAPGADLDAEALVAELDELGYREAEGSGALTQGTYRVADDVVAIGRRPLPMPGAAGGGVEVRVAFAGDRVREVTEAGVAVEQALLDPPLVASYYGPDLRERRPVGLDELPEELILAVLAAEDARFLEHRGISLLGILRAAWVNVRSDDGLQGGSTLTQQLVKNLYLTHERTLARKLREAVLAIALELRFSKREILEAYINEIYFGRSGRVDLMGIGAAAWAYYGKHPSQLELAESATLAGIIPAPGNFSPLTHPERARSRRDLVLARLGTLEWIEPARLEAAAARPIAASQAPLVARHAPYFADFAAQEAQQRYGIADLDDAGYAVFTTLDPGDQRWAEEAVQWGLGELEASYEKGNEATGPLEAALVSIEPTTGAILAYVGGRDYAASQFDRVTLAKRQAGSAFKPIVYAAAFRDHTAHPATFLEDRPLTMRLPDGQRWTPQNSSGTYQGWVTARTALEKSLNVPTARLAVDVGLERIVELAHRMGITAELDPYPALALGAMEVTPLEMATVYATFAAQGVRPPVHAISAVYDRLGQPVDGSDLPPRQRVLEAPVAYMVDRILQGVLLRGTATTARTVHGIRGPVAGKTGTTNDRRDSWFAGFTPSRASLVWVGYDDNSQTRLSGTRAGVPIWSRFAYRLQPADGWDDFRAPDGVVEVLIDPTTGGLATDRCPDVLEEVFLRDFAPAGLCPEHGFWRGRPLPQEDIGTPTRRNPFRRWLDLVRGQRDGAAPGNDGDAGTDDVDTDG